MGTFLIAVIVSLVLSIGLVEVTSSITYGWFLSKNEVDDYLKQYKKFTLNRFTDEILQPDTSEMTIEEIREMVRGDAFISKTIASFFSKYYISGKGKVFIWSEGSKKIDKIYQNLK